jgi:signal transduction histidine kinase
MHDRAQATSSNVLQLERLDELKATALLDSPIEENYDRFTRLASSILKTPVSLVSLVDHDRQFFKSSIGLQEPWSSHRQTPLSHSFCQHVVDRALPLRVVDARLDPLLKHNLAVTELGVVAYLGIPIITAKGHTLGSFCAIDDHPREWTSEEIAMLEDLTELLIRQIEFRILAQQLHADYLELRNLELFRDETVQMLVHDLRNPLTSFLGGIDLTQKCGDLNDPQTRYLDIARKGGRVLLQMINGILDARTGEGQLIALKKTNCPPSQIIQDACEEMAPLADASAVELTWHTESDLSFCADADKLRRVLVNLIGNAIQHTPAGGKITVLAQANDQRSVGDYRANSIVFSVTDNGHGISRTALAKFCDQLDLTQKTWVKETSTGLGLPFSKMAIEAHGGRIWIESTIGHGTRFYFTIPLANHQP